MNTIKDTDNYKVYEELIEGYDYFYTLEKTSYPYYLLTHIDIYRKNVIKLSIKLDVRPYSNTMGAEYEKVTITSNTFKRIININHYGMAESDVVIGSDVDSIHYEKFIVKKYILNYIYQKKDLLSTPIEKKKKLSIFKRIKNKKLTNS